MTNLGKASNARPGDQDEDEGKPGNQTAFFEDVNLYTSDKALKEAVAREGGSHASRALVSFGLVCGSADYYERARLANEHMPELHTHNALGERIDEVRYHPAYHELMEIACSESLHCAPWLHLVNKQGSPSEDQQVARAAGLYLAGQVEPGHLTSISMTHAAVPALIKDAELADKWLPLIVSRSYDPTPEAAEEKRSISVGLGLTEKQAGSDVRDTMTIAEPCDAASPTSDSAGVYELKGHKWFLSAPMSDAFLMTARTGDALSCFFVPRLLEESRRNGISFQRLKKKLGNRSCATAEAELVGTRGYLIGELGDGTAVIADTLSQLRLDRAVLSTALMRQALAQAIHHSEHRSAFGKRLVDQPLVGQVLADLALDVEAATALVFRLARSLDRRKDQQAGAWMRLMTPVTAFWTTKIASGMISEVLECLGGNSYIDDMPVARAYREAPANALMAGTGNVLVLDVLRVLQREPEMLNVVMDDLAAASADDPHLNAAHKRIESILHDPRQLDLRGRALTEGIAVLAAGTILRAHAPAAVAEAFIATRMGSLNRQTYGQGVDWADTRAIIARASPSS